MKWILLLAGLSFGSQAANAMIWSDLEVGQNYQITTGLSLGSSAVVSKNEKLILAEHMPLDYIRVQLFRFRLANCSQPRAQIQADMILHDDLYGIQWLPGCILEVFLENQDLSRDAFFSVIPAI